MGIKYYTFCKVILILVFLCTYLNSIFAQQDSIKLKKTEDSLRLIPDPNESRMLLGPTGKTLKGGKAYISMATFFPYFTIPLFFPFSSFGITDYINIGAGASIWPPVFYIAPKIRPLSTKNINLSFGFAYAQTYTFEDISDAYNAGLFGR